MQTQHIPVLIFAQSGRYLAQSASQAGYTAWVADCFGDSDTLAAAERWQLVPPLAELSHQNIMTTLSELAHGQHCMLVCGSGIEQCYLKLFPLPANIQLVGNTPDTIHRVKTPSIFFHILSQQGFNYPATIFQPPTDELHWLKKKASGLGGSHIEYAAFNSNEINTEYYYQRFISGRSGSCLFLADGYHAQLLTVNQQFPATDSNSGSPFLLARIESAWTLSASQQHYLNNMINQLTAATMLVGLNSLDFMLSDKNELLILEINPRPSASAELLENGPVLFQHHIKACLGQLTKVKQHVAPTKMSLFYHYATSDCIVPEKMKWPTTCNDLPCQGTTIKKYDVICSSRVEAGQHNSAMKLHLNIEQKILQQLLISR